MKWQVKPIGMLWFLGVVLSIAPGWAMEDFAPKGWQSLRPGVWQKKNKKEEVITYHKLEGVWFDIEKSGGETYSAKLESTRQKMDQILGIKDWKIESHELVKSAGGNPLWVFTASYQFAQKKHYLLEFQEFRKPHIYQVQFKSASPIDLHDKKAASLYSEIQGRFQ